MKKADLPIKRTPRNSPHIKFNVRKQPFKYNNDFKIERRKRILKLKYPNGTEYGEVIKLFQIHTEV